jgi:hypothetical protein
MLPQRNAVSALGKHSTASDPPGYKIVGTCRDPCMMDLTLRKELSFAPPPLRRTSRHMISRMPWWRSRRSSEPPAPFIVGAARSGTTLLRMMLDAHPLMAIPPETGFLPKAAREWNRARNPPDAFLTVVTGRSTWSTHGVSVDALRVKLSDAPDAGEAVRCFYRLYADRFDKPRWGDKTPRYVRKMIGIQRVLPEAHFIHVIRDGRDVVLSSQRAFGTRSIATRARDWADDVSIGRRHHSELRHYREIRYEDLVLNPERELQEICEFIALPFAAQMLGYHRFAGERLREREYERAQHALVASPPQPARIGSWKHEMSAAEKLEFEAVAGALLDELGYER